MAKKSIIAKLEAMKRLELMWDSKTSIPDSKGGEVHILKLTDPIPYVRGSQDRIIAGTTIPVDANDVNEVRIHSSTLQGIQDKYDQKYDDLVDQGKQAEADALDLEIEFDEDGSGAYAGSTLQLDVAARDRQVWLVLPENNFRNASTKGRQDRVLETYGLKRSTEVRVTA